MPKRGDRYWINWRDQPEPGVLAAMARPGWEDFHNRCGEIRVYFGEYRTKRRVVTVQVFTAVNVIRYGSLKREKMWLAEGIGRSVVAASIDGLRKSGGSSLPAWLAALHMAVAELKECVNGAEGLRAGIPTITVAG